MVIKNFKTVEKLQKEISWFERKLEALNDKSLSIKLVGEQNVLMTIGATVENESFYGVLAVEFVENLRKDIKGKLVSLDSQLATLTNTEHSNFNNVQNSQGLQYDLSKNNPPDLQSFLRTTEFS